MGVIDVEEFLDKTPTSVMDFWEAFDSIEPIGEQWLQTAQLSFLLDRLFASMIKGGKVHEVEEFMPPRYKPTEKAPGRKPVQSVGDIRSALQSLMGNNKCQAQ
jgi:hypothetical protein